MNKLKVMTIVGTRPEIIKLSEVMKELDRHVNHIIVHTGQNYDYELNKIFFDELNIKKPKYYLDVDTNSLGKVLGNTLIKIEEVLIKEKPDAVLILGDTNSSISAIMAKRFHIPVYHMEAGNRSFDLNVPEEINRKIIDHIADINMPYSDIAREYLIREGIQPDRIIKTGSPMNEVIKYNFDGIISSNIMTSMKLKKEDVR